MVSLGPPETKATRGSGPSDATTNSFPETLIKTARPGRASHDGGQRGVAAEGARLQVECGRRAGGGRGHRIASHLGGKTGYAKPRRRRPSRRVDSIRAGPGPAQPRPASSPSSCFPSLSPPHSGPDPAACEAEPDCSRRTRWAAPRVGRASPGWRSGRGRAGRREAGAGCESACRTRGSGAARPPAPLSPPPYLVRDAENPHLRAGPPPPPSLSSAAAASELPASIELQRPQHPPAAVGRAGRN